MAVPERLKLSLPRRNFPVAGPAWAGANSTITVNGRPWNGRVIPGRFARLEREWKPNDEVVLTLDQPLRLEPLSAAHPELVALMRGPRALFAADALDVPVTRAGLLAARPDPARRETWLAAAPDGKEVPFKPFTAIGDETYRLYSPVTV